MYERRGGQAPPSLEYMSGVNMIRSRVNMIRSGWIWLGTHTFPFIWPCIMASVSTEKFDFNKKLENKNINTIKTYHITKKTFYMKIHQEKTQKKNK